MIYTLSPERKHFLESHLLLLQLLHSSQVDLQQQMNIVDRKQLQTSFFTEREERIELELLRNELRRQIIQLERLLIELENQQTLFASPSC